MNDSELRDRLVELEQSADTYQQDLGQHSYARGIRAAVEYIEDGLESESE